MNPAEELLDIFKRWEANKGATIFLARGPQNGITYDLAKEITYATSLFQEVIKLLEASDDIDDWREFIEATWKHLYAPRTDWCTNTSSTGITVPGLVRTGLRGASSTISSKSPDVSINTDLTDDEIAALVKTLQEVKEQIGAIPQRYQKLTDSITSKLDDCLFILSTDDVPPGRLREAREKSLELVGESLHAVILLPEEKRKSFFKNLMNISGVWVGNMTAGAAGGMLENITSSFLGVGS
ncbi:hypothetical protein ACN08Y_10430 [Rothia sp. P5764]|uniref:hypothetical protein n=1 Tax=Rothia sp. P5764 TaxID=3402654 RepID=UPI003AC3C956